jgi:hypothetical protein
MKYETHANQLKRQPGYRNQTWSCVRCRPASDFAGCLNGELIHACMCQNQNLSQLLRFYVTRSGFLPQRKKEKCVNVCVCMDVCVPAFTGGTPCLVKYAW